MNNTGIIYLIQPFEFCGTDIYKIGMSSKETIERIKAYKKGTRILFIYNCPNPKFFETELIKMFNNRFTIHHGKEYFRVHIKEKYLKQEMFEFCLCTEIEYEKVLIELTEVVKPKDTMIYKCGNCNDTGKVINFKNLDCTQCMIAEINKTLKITCNLCYDTGWYEKEEGNVCWAGVKFTGELCPAGQKREEERLMKKLEDIKLE